MAPTLPAATASLHRTSLAIAALLDGVEPEQARFKPAPSRWSMIEVINHLVDEEVEDFRRRLDLLLHHPDRRWPPNDPEGWVTERRYAERAMEPSVQRFLEERRISLAWLRELWQPRWENRYDHPSVGPITAGDLLASWVAHDLHHVRQLTVLHYDFLRHSAAPVRLEYAGDW